MNVHIKILALIYLVIGGLLAISVTAFHVHLFSSADIFDASVMDGGFGFSRAFDRYAELLGIFGMSLMSVFSVLLTIIISILFGIGLLRRRKWAVYPGLFIAVIGVISVAANFANNKISVSVLQILLSCYTFLVLTSKKVWTQTNAADENLPE